jgi:hypothetical protein
MFRYELRTLLIVLALGPMVLYLAAWLWDWFALTTGIAKP